MSKHTVNGNPGDGWYCYSCEFFTRNVEEAAKHDGIKYSEASPGQHSVIVTKNAEELLRAASGSGTPAQEKDYE